MEGGGGVQGTLTESPAVLNVRPQLRRWQCKARPSCNPLPPLIPHVPALHYLLTCHMYGNHAHSCTCQNWSSSMVTCVG